MWSLAHQIQSRSQNHGLIALTYRHHGDTFEFQVSLRVHFAAMAESTCGRRLLSGRWPKKLVPPCNRRIDLSISKKVVIKKNKRAPGAMQDQLDAITTSSTQQKRVTRPWQGNYLCHGCQRSYHERRRADGRRRSLLLVSWSLCSAAVCSRGFDCVSVRLGA